MERIMTHTPEAISAARDEHGRVEIKVAKGETAWDPSSTKRVIHGPVTVKYVYFPDGGIEATVFGEPNHGKSFSL